jgi:hypothetical protein
MKRKRIIEIAWDNFKKHQFIKAFLIVIWIVVPSFLTEKHLERLAKSKGRKII